MKRQFVGIELESEHVKLAELRLAEAIEATKAIETAIETNAGYPGEAAGANKPPGETQRGRDRLPGSPARLEQRTKSASADLRILSPGLSVRRSLNRRRRGSIPC